MLRAVPWSVGEARPFPGLTCVRCAHRRLVTDRSIRLEPPRQWDQRTEMSSPDDDDEALATLELALAAIRRDVDRDESTERVIQAMEDKRAELIAAKLRRDATPPRPRPE